MLEQMLENPEVAKAMFKEVVKQYKPLLYSVLGELFDVYKDYANNTEYFATAAQVRRNQFESLVNAGFTEDQAMALLIDNIERTKEFLRNSSSVNASKSNKSKKINSAYHI